MKSIIFALILALASTLSFAHDDHDHDHHKEELQESYRELFQNLSVDKSYSESDVRALNLVKIEIGQTKYYLPETTLAMVVKSHIKAYEETVREYCECDISELQADNHGKFREIMERIITFIPELGHILSDMVWSEVAGGRRYGLVYIIVSAIGEIIDHNISPVPLCKFVAFISRAISDKIKTASALLWPVGKYNPIDKYKALYSRMIYRKQFRKKWQSTLESTAQTQTVFTNESLKFSQKLDYKMRHLEVGYQALKKFPESFSPNEVIAIDINKEVELAMSELNTMEKMWYTDRVIDYFNFTYSLMLENAKILKHEKEINKTNFFKVQWAVGGYGAQIDKLKISLYVASSIKSEEKKAKAIKEIQEQIGSLLTNFKKFQDLFQQIDNDWEPYSKINIKEMTVKNVNRSKCFQLVTKIISWKTVVATSLTAWAYHILNEQSDVSESW